MAWEYGRYICNCCGHFVRFEVDDHISYCPRCGVPVEENPGRIGYNDIIERLSKEPNRAVNKKEAERVLGVIF